MVNEPLIRPYFGGGGDVNAPYPCTHRPGNVRGAPVAWKNLWIWCAVIPVGLPWGPATVPKRIFFLAGLKTVDFCWKNGDEAKITSKRHFQQYIPEYVRIIKM